MYRKNLLRVYFGLQVLVTFSAFLYLSPWAEMPPPPLVSLTPVAAHVLPSRLSAETLSSHVPIDGQICPWKVCSYASNLHTPGPSRFLVTSTVSSWVNDAYHFLPRKIFTLSTLWHSLQGKNNLNTGTGFFSWKWMGFGGRGPRLNGRHAISLVCDDKRAAYMEDLPCAKSFTQIHLSL